MLRVFSQTILALLLLTAGGYLTFIFLQHLSDGTGVWAMLCAIPILTSGILLLLRAGKSDETVMKKTKIESPTNQASENSEGFKKILERNNQITKTWDKTNETKTRLRMLSVSDDPGSNS